MRLTTEQAADWAQETIETFIGGAGCGSPGEAIEALTVLIVMAGYGIEGAAGRAVALEAMIKAANIVKTRKGTSEVRWQTKS